MSVLFERGNVELFNHTADENLGYDSRHRPFVREWVEFGRGGSPDLLDACVIMHFRISMSVADMSLRGWAFQAAICTDEGKRVRCLNNSKNG